MGTFLSPDSINVYMRFYLKLTEIEEKYEQLRLLSSKKQRKKGRTVVCEKFVMPTTYN